MAKIVKAKAAPLSASHRRLVSSASELGYNVAGGFEAVVAVLSKLTVADVAAIDAFARQYKLGFGVRYRELHDKRFAKRTGNMPLAEKLDEIGEAFDRTYRSDMNAPDKKGMRTQFEQRMCKGADQSWMRVREAAGLKVAKKRKARATKANVTPATDIPADLSKLTPTFKTKEAANDFFANIAAALLTTCDSNNSKSKGKLVIPALTSAVSDFQAAVKKALGLK